MPEISAEFKKQLDKSASDYVDSVFGEKNIAFQYVAHVFVSDRLIRAANHRLETTGSTEGLEIERFLKMFGDNMIQAMEGH